MPDQKDESRRPLPPTGIILAVAGALLVVAGVAVFQKNELAGIGMGAAGAVLVAIRFLAYRG